MQIKILLKISMWISINQYSGLEDELGTQKVNIKKKNSKKYVPCYGHKKSP